MISFIYKNVYKCGRRHKQYLDSAEGEMYWFVQFLVPEQYCTRAPIFTRSVVCSEKSFFVFLESARKKKNRFENYTKTGQKKKRFRLSLFLRQFKS